jgi:hypothetical protein
MINSNSIRTIGYLRVSVYYYLVLSLFPISIILKNNFKINKIFFFFIFIQNSMRSKCFFLFMYVRLQVDLIKNSLFLLFLEGDIYLFCVCHKYDFLCCNRHFNSCMSIPAINLIVKISCSVS